jgi:uncharacterized protein YecE (DUF72 family)
MVRIGTSGWSYPAGQGTWNGVFYPKPRPRGFDELAYYAEHFDTVEVNSTFYRVPEAAQVARWVARTPADFLFAVKLYQKFTHPDMYLKQAGVTDWSPSPADIDLFRTGIEPLAAAGRLGALLLQFPSSLHASPAAGDYLSWLLDQLRAYPSVVEMRHRSWFEAGSAEAGGDLAARLRGTGAGLVVADDPESAKLTSAPDVISAPLYLRLHGRNAAAWWHHAAAEDRYNYLYSPAELRPFADQAQDAAAAGRRVFAFMNNHFSAKAVANAAVLKSQLGQDLPGEYEPELVAHYPDLQGLVRVRAAAPRLI